VSEPDWVKLTTGLGSTCLMCERCHTGWTLLLPLPVRDVLDQVVGFSELHSSCEVRP
jgi:hypothetical protein